MMRLKVENISEGLHPSERVVSVRTKDGSEELAVDPRSLLNNTLLVGWPVATDNGFLLVELPRQTSRGSRRVWVRKEDLIEEEPMRARA